ncbi:MAG: hypothetical protein GY801_15285, partial [bacterium]|nr:hypothetical protein [bacterium]
MDSIRPAALIDTLRKAEARWISRDSLVWDSKQHAGSTPCLYYSSDGNFSDENGELRPGPQGKVFDLHFNGRVGETDSAHDRKLAYLASLNGQSRIDTRELCPEELLDGALVLGIKDADGRLLNVTGIQTAGILDDLYAYDGELGPVFSGDTPNCRLWAPTAQHVELHLYLTSESDAVFEGSPFEMTKLMEDERWTGVWEIEGHADWKDAFYLYEVTVLTFWSGKLERYLVTDP